MNKITYQSNPFKSAFHGLDLLFKINQIPAIIILAFSYVGIFMQGAPTTFWNPFAEGSDQLSGGVIALIVTVVAILALTALVVSFFIGVFVSGITGFVAYKTIRGESTTIGEAFHETLRRFWSIAYVLVIAGLKIFGGLLLFIVPGVRAALRYQMAVIPLFDENLSGKVALQRVKFLTKGHILELFGIQTVAVLIFPISSLMQLGGHVVLYPQLKDIKDHNKPKPKVHWLNYLGFVLIALWLIATSLIMWLIVWLVQRAN